MKYLLALLACVATAQATELVRGPYLQLSTPSSLVVRWRTDVGAESTIAFGTILDHPNRTAGDPGPRTDHEVKLTELLPGTRYFYTIRDGMQGLASGPDYFFITPPPVGQPKPTRIWVIGDGGTGNATQSAVRDAYYNYTGSRYTDVWLALGDNAYFSGTDAEYQVNFFDVFPALSRQSVVWPTIGNHETYSVPAGERIPYLDMFTLPQSGQAGGIASGTENYYSFDHANIHFVCLDSELSDRTPDGAMLTWLREDLAENDADWLIAYWHSPPYTKGSHDSDNLNDNFGNMTDMRQNAVSILETYGVDLVLSGHSHIYERSFLLNGNYGFAADLTPSMLKDAGSGRYGDTGPYRKGTAGPGANQGAVYIVAGSGGQVGGRSGFHPVMFFDELQPGSVVLDVEGRRLDAKFLRETGAVDDFFTIIKGVAPAPLRICTFTLSNGDTIVRWKSIAGQSYIVQRTLHLTNANWQPVSDPIIATGATSTWAANAPAETKAFYRVVQLPPAP